MITRIKMSNNSLKLLFCCLESFSPVVLIVHCSERRCIEGKVALLKGPRENSNLCLLTVKVSLEKEVCNFKWCLVSGQKYTKSFGGKNLALCGRIFPVKN